MNSSVKHKIESISIKNFGPIKNITIEDIKPFTVIIGSSGIGKSTLMKVLALFRWIYKMANIRSYLSYSGVKKSPFKFRMDSYIRNSGWEDYVTKDTYVRYKYGSYELILENKKLKGSNVKISEEELQLEKISFISDNRIAISNILLGKLRSDSFYLSETLSDFEEAMKSIDEHRINSLGVNFVKAKGRNGKTSYKVVADDADKPYSIKVSSASSGTQSLIPLSVIVEYFTKHYSLIKSFNRAIFKYISEEGEFTLFSAVTDIGKIPNKRVSLHIEEPELSLSPNKQIPLINELVRKCMTEGTPNYELNLMMTTHSPYIINQLNLLLLANNKGRTIEGASLDFNQMEVYHFTDEGYLRSLKAVNKQFIDTTPLSNDISSIYEQYRELYELSK